MTVPNMPLDPFAVDPSGGPDRLKENVSTILSTAAILALSGGTGWGLWQHIGPWAVVVAGAVLALLVAITDEARKPRVGDDADEPMPAPSPPGPTHPGNLHTRGPGSER